MPAPTLFAFYGVELEYMIIDAETLAVRPWADRVLLDSMGLPTSDVGRGRITWSNELMAHVIELKTTQPEASLTGLAEQFAAEVAEINARLRPHGLMVLPTAMHPTMRPDEAVLWAHEYNDVYATFDRIFDCRGHGWSNLQSVHLNLPFANDAEFGRLHAAVRLVLPLLPALAASSPFVEGRMTGWPDNRLAFYRHNSAKLPALCGQVIPEPVYTKDEYKRVIFDPIAAQLALHDPNGNLQAEFSNSRGAIARFDRASIEIRVLDVQECPAADLAIVRLIVALLQELVAETNLSGTAQRAWPVAPLRAWFDATVERGGDALVDDAALRRAFGVAGNVVTVRQLWGAVIDRIGPTLVLSPAEAQALATIRKHGCLADRLRQAQAAGESIDAMYRRLAAGVPANRPFLPLSRVTE
jgi:glutamate---cysteine ligase / carboxylate-amine ligase